MLYIGAVGESGDVTLESWECLDGMIKTAIKTGHSSYYVERSLASRGKIIYTLQTLYVTWAFRQVSRAGWT